MLVNGEHVPGSQTCYQCEDYSDVLVDHSAKQETSKERLNILQEKIESLGFEIYHDFVGTVELIGVGTYHVDFTYIEPERYALYAMQKIYSLGVDCGKQEIKKEFKFLLGIVD